MSKTIKILLSIGFLILIIKVGEIARRYIDKDYANKVKVETWNSRLAEFQKQNIETPLNEKLESFLGTIDSSSILESVGCIQGYFGHLSSEYVLKIPSSIYTEKETMKEYNLNERGLQCELLVFEKDSSHLANICTDVIIMNYPKTKKTIKSIGGTMKVFIGNKEELWGNKVNNSYIKINKIEFIDSLNNNKKIVFKDKFLWKVINLGTPG